MNEEKIKELEAQIKALKEEKPRTNVEVLESIENILEKLVEERKQSTNKPLFEVKIKYDNDMPIGTLIEDELDTFYVNRKPFDITDWLY